MNILVRSIHQVDSVPTGTKKDDLFLCANRTTYEYCQKRSLRSFLLDEENIREEYRAINTWALEKTFLLIEKFASDKNKAVYLDSNFMYWEGLFAQVIKIIRALDDAVKKNGIREIAVPDDKSSLLSEICRLYVQNNKPGWSLELLDYRKQTASKTPSLKAAAYACLAKVANIQNWMKLKKAKKSGRKIAVLSGGINHLSSLALKLKQNGEHEIVFCENTFTLEKLRFCRENGYIFVTAPGYKKNPFGADEKPFGDGEMIYRGKDYTNIYNEIFLSAFKTGLFGYWFDESVLTNLIRDFDADFVLLDEDMGPRRLFLKLAELFQKKCFVVSHGVPGILLQEEEGRALMGRYKSGATFVHSAFEKSVYESICYKPEDMIETGVPRYDEIFHIKKNLSREDRKIKTILYCASSMTNRGFDDWWPWLGFKNFFGDQTRRYTADVVRALQGMADIELKIKPHYCDEAAIKQLIEKLNPNNLKYEVMTHRANIFKLEAEADLIITPESSVICEGIMFEKPVLILNYAPEALMAPYDKDGLALQVQSSAELSSAIQRCFDSDYLSQLSSKRRQFFKGYAGQMDGKCTDRAAEYILKNKDKTIFTKKPNDYEAVRVL